MAGFEFRSGLVCIGAVARSMPLFHQYHVIRDSELESTVPQMAQ